VRYTRHVEFEWEPDKAAENLRKHGVSFKEASTVFGDHLGVAARDPDHSIGEERFILVGSSVGDGCCSFAILCHPGRAERVRIISASRADKT
jgi:uncharacterized protein